MVQDVFSRLEWDTEDEITENIPATVRFGVSLQFTDTPITLAVDGMKVVNEGDIVVRIGREIRPTRFFGVRAGYTGESPTFGAFVLLPSVGQFDYAATQDELSNALSHHIGLLFTL